MSFPVYQLEAGFLPEFEEKSFKITSNDANWPLTWPVFVKVNYHGRIVEQRHKAELQKVLQAAEKRQK